MRSGLRLFRRVAVTIVGVGVLAVGLALLVLPGPGFLVIALGFLVLAFEYEWARRRFQSARSTAADLSRQTAANRLSTTFAILFALGVVALGLTLGLVPSLPLAGWWTGASLIVSGLVVLGTVLYGLWHARRIREDGDGPAVASEPARVPPER